ncbi:putative inner membrane protein [Klebsiella pneumoniae]|uniref:Putative inner membrane protein n=1 Tax=Klebsiella pneumoniae TaxID=573 RepID=A0A377TWD9_KLEPN|nr:putative inner membrane protein [Klebsiella pneumoniae]
MAILQTGLAYPVLVSCPGGHCAGILSTYYFGITGTFWAVTGEFTRWGGQLLQLLASTANSGAITS